MFSHEFPPAIGGAGSVAYIYAQQLAKIGCQVKILTKNYTNNIEIPDVDFVRVNCTKRIPWIFYRSACKSIDADLIILNDSVAVLAASLWFDRSKLKNSLVFLHGSEPELFFHSKSATAKLLLYKYRYIHVLSQCRRIVAVSNFMRCKFLGMTGLSELAEKISVHYTIVDRDVFHIDSDTRSEALNHQKQNNLVRLFTASRIVKGKGFDDMLKIFKRLVDSDKLTNWEWIIAGDGDYLEHLIELARKFNLHDKIYFIGRRNSFQLAELYRTSTVFWLLSNYEESYGLVYKEAQACGCPTIGRNRSGVVEAISNGINGFLVDSNEECYEIMYHKKFSELEEKLSNAHGDYEGYFTFRDEM